MRARFYFASMFGVALLAAASYACNAILGLDEIGTLADIADAPSDISPSVDAPTDAPAKEAGPSGSPDIVDVQMGAFHGCALDKQGFAWCWGNNGFSELGTPFGDPRPRAEAILGVPAISQLSVGMTHACGVTATGAVWCWGQNDKNQLGHDNTIDGNCSAATKCATPQVVPNLSARSVLALFGITCAVTMTNDVVCWGANDSLMLGTGTDAGSSATPVVVEGLAKLAVPPTLEGAPWSGKLACVRVTKDDVRCWGENLSDSAGHPRGTNGDQSTDPFANATPTTVTGGVADSVVVVASWVSCATTFGNQIRCWGGNSCGQLAQPQGTADGGIADGGIGGSSASPVRVNIPPADLVRVGNAACVRMEGDHSVTCWGEDTDGIVGATQTSPCTSYGGVAGAFGTATPTNRPDVIARSLSVGFKAAAAVDPNGHVLAWGSNPNGQLGHAKGTMGDDDAGTYRNPVAHFVDGLGP